MGIKQMKFYFAGSIRAGRADINVYQELIGFLHNYGQVLTEQVGSAGLEGEVGLSEAEIFERDLHWLREADLFIAEVTTPSLGVGYEIAVAESLGKPVLCLYNLGPGKKLSAMLLGNQKIAVHEYQTLAEAKAYIDEFIAGHAWQMFGARN